MSVIYRREVFERNITPVSPQVQARMELGLRLLAGDVPVSAITDLEGFGASVYALIDGLTKTADEIAFEQRRRGTSPHHIKTVMQNTCPLMAALYRAEAIAGDRICNDQSAISKLATIHDLLVEGIEEKFGGEFENPIYPETAAYESKAKRWREIATRVED